METLIKKILNEQQDKPPTPQMKIISIKVIDGKNDWSKSKNKLIQMVLNLGKMEELPSNKIDGFYERMVEMIPSLYEHRCSPGYKGGFFERVKEGTWMGHIVEHIALELQTLAGIDVGWGRTRGTGERGQYNVVFNYICPEVGIYAAEVAVDIVETLIKGDEYNIEEDINTMKEMIDNECNLEKGVVLQEQNRIKLNEPLEIGDFVKVIDIGYSDDVHWGRGELLTPDTNFKMPKLYDLYEVIEKGIVNTTQEPFYLLLNPDDKEEHAKVKGFREGNMLEKLLYPSLDVWLKVEENEVLKEHEEKREVDPPIKEGDYIIVIDQDDDRWEPSKTIPRDPSGMSGRGNMIEAVKSKAPELYTKYEVGEYIPYESRWWPFEIPIWKLWKGNREEGRREWGFGQGGYEARLYPYAHTYIKAEDNEILSEERKRKRHAPWMDLDVGDEIVVVHIDKEKMKRGRSEMPELYTTYIVVASHPYAVKNYYTIVDKDIFDEVEEKGEYSRRTKEETEGRTIRGDAIVTAWKGRWGPEAKIIFQGFDEFILRED